MTKASKNVQTTEELAIYQKDADRTEDSKVTIKEFQVSFTENSRLQKHRSIFITWMDNIGADEFAQ